MKAPMSTATALGSLPVPGGPLKSVCGPLALAAPVGLQGPAPTPGATTGRAAR